MISQSHFAALDGTAGLREQLFAETQRHSLAQAAKVLVVADPASSGVVRTVKA